MCANKIGLICCALFFVLISKISLSQVPLTLNVQDNGYRGIWYADQPSNDIYRYKYSGGLGTYPANHYPFSIYVKKVDKTFFCYGASDEKGTTLLHAISYFDHKTKKVPKPTIVLDKKTDNAHDNPVLNIDEEGYIWLFSTSHGTNTTSYIHKSKKPYDISEFERITSTYVFDGKIRELNNFSYLQSWYKAGEGFLNFFTHYDRNVIPNQPKKPRRTIAFMKSKDGIDYDFVQNIATIEEGHYQTSGSFDNKIWGTTFNYHPIKVGVNGLNFRTNLYYLETRDFGKTWQNIFGEMMSLPLQEIDNKALVKDYSLEGKNVYINDLTYDNQGNPIILYILSEGYESGPKNDPREWFTAHYLNGSWRFQRVTTSDNNYDMGSLYVDKNGDWRIVAPTKSGPQEYNTGGEMMVWESKNRGKTWKGKQITFNSLNNHSYARRPVSVHPDFYAFWADGNSREKSVSRLYFSDKSGRVFKLPENMKSEFEKPILIN